MEQNQRINCTVHTCKFNKQQQQECALKQILVEPIQNCQTKQADESMCGSYEYQQQQDNQQQQPQQQNQQ